MARRPEPKEKSRFWLPALLVVVATAGAVILIGGGDSDDEPSNTATEPVPDDVLEIQPMVPRGKLMDASWRKDDGAKPAPQPEEDEYAAFFKGEENLDPFGDEARGRKRADEALKETVRDIQGLGVYVAPEPAEEQEEK
jgi:hypothetical protein